MKSYGDVYRWFRQFRPEWSHYMVTDNYPNELDRIIGAVFEVAEETEPFEMFYLIKKDAAWFFGPHRDALVMMRLIKLGYIK